MSSLRKLLQETDPLRHEAPRLDVERERIRRRILGAVPIDRPTSSARVRLRIAATFMMVAIGVAALSYLAWVHGTTPLQAAVRFEVRLAEERPIPGPVVAEVADTGRLIYLYPETVVTNDDIAQSWVSNSGSDRFEVAVQFLPSGAARMQQATSSPIGRPMAILIDGHIAMAPVVRSPISDSAVITGDYTRSEAESIADGILGR